MAQRRNTHQRQLVYDAVQMLYCHPTVNEIYDYVHAKDTRVSLATVYRNLNLLADEGAIKAVKTPDGCHFDHRTDAHNHIVCTSCGSMIDALAPYDARADSAAQESSGYIVHSHYTVFEGLCPRCQGIAFPTA